jgi:hypothetical protein
MKTYKLLSGLLIAALVPFLMACPKSKPTVAPEPDTETQSSVDVSLLNHMVMDMDMLCAFVGENDLSPDFYGMQPGTSQTVTVTRDIAAKQLVVSYNNTSCIDGAKRDGSFFMVYTDAPNINYYRDYGYVATLTNNDDYVYKINDWTVKVPNGKAFKISNALSSPTFDPKKTPLSWIMEGSLQFIHQTDPSKNMIWEGKFTKTLVNSGDPAVYNPNGQEMIHWAKAVVAYTGKATGVTPGNEPYTFEIDSYHPLTRDFTCYPDKVSGVISVQPFRTWTEEFHPVKSGIASFTTDHKYTRQIYYGNEGDPGLLEQCDNSGEVLIKGNTYRVDFIK